MDCMIDVDIELKDSIHIKEYIDSAWDEAQADEIIKDKIYLGNELISKHI